MTKQEAINQVTEAFPSIWSREDVLRVLNEIDDKSTKLFDADRLIDKIKDSVESTIDRMNYDDIVDTSNCDFSIRNGNEIEIDEVSINKDDIVSEVIRDVVLIIEEFLEEEEEREEVA
jgi:hypothetical protein